VTRIRVASNQLKKYPLIGRAVLETAKENIQPEDIYFFSLYPFAIF
jgi:hypothetical protein